MQVWDIVQVSAVDHDHDGAAGVVIRAHADHGIFVVKIDEVAEPENFAESELTLLAR